MTDGKWIIQLSMIGPFGERYTMALPLDEATARDIERISPPDALADFVPNVSPLTATVKKLRLREFRKDLFADAAMRLGKLLAERMEDAEGWHGVSREGPARTSLSRYGKIAEKDGE